MHRIAARLAELGMPIDPAEVFAIVKEGSAGRPHVAQVDGRPRLREVGPGGVRPVPLGDRPGERSAQTVHARRGRPHHPARPRSTGARSPRAREPRRADPRAGRGGTHGHRDVLSRALGGPDVGVPRDVQRTSVSSRPAAPTSTARASGARGIRAFSPCRRAPGESCRADSRRWPPSRGLRSRERRSGPDLRLHRLPGHAQGAALLQGAQRPRALRRPEGAPGRARASSGALPRSSAPRR